MNWIKKIFHPKGKDEQPNLTHEEEMLKRLDVSITQCNQEIKKAGEETDQIKKWAAEAILEAFNVPNKMWYAEIEKYGEIKSLEENKSIDYKVVLKCDEVINGYLEQITIREAKIELYHTLIQKYSATKDKMEKIKKRSDDELEAQAKLRVLEKHSQRIDQLQNSPANQNDHIEGSIQLELLKEEAKALIDEFEISEEVKSSLEEISQHFIAGKYHQNAKSAIDEIVKLVDKIKKQD